MTPLSWADIHLIRAMGLTPDDLETNHAGRLSATQHERLEKPFQSYLKTITGPIKKEPTIKSSYYFVQCQGERFQVSQKIFHILFDEEVYRFHHVTFPGFLIDDHVIVAIEYAGTPINDYPSDSLCDVLQITGEDVAANRQGHLSKAQARVLRQKNLKNAHQTIIFLMITGVILMLLQPKAAWLAGDVIIYGCGALFLLPALFILYWIDTARRAITKNTVAAYHGRVDISDAFSLDLMIEGQKRFPLWDKSSAFIPGEIYTVYYVPYKDPFVTSEGFILSAEHHPQ